MSKAKLTPEQTAANIARVIELRKAGNTRLQIGQITKFQDRFIRQHMKGVEVATKPAKVTQLSVAASKVYPLAIRPQGCKDYELRNIAHEVYGTKLNEEKGITTTAYNKDTLYSIKKRVHEMAAGEMIDGEPVNPQFVMDWICDERPAASRVALEVASLELSRRFDEMLSEFLCEFMVEPESDELVLTEAQGKQRYAARRHMLKLAFPEFNVNGEPLEVLLARSESQTDKLESTQDLPVVQTPIKYFEAAVEPLEAVTDDITNNLDAFFEDVATAEESFISRGAPVSIKSEDDIFASVGVASVDQIKYSREKLDKHTSNLESLLSDDGVCIGMESKNICAYGFDITKYLGGNNALSQKHSAIHPASFDYDSEPF
ncbi:hypothetical protein [Pseudomonas syringae]|uniref:hypothetical protein n=1 Tax=Pseudomonas syringae TaxID=317 RepID=UPI000E327A24|nr:hypothetical protein [Pseudomonas syringae]